MPDCTVVVITYNDARSAAQGRAVGARPVAARPRSDHRRRREHRRHRTGGAGAPAGGSRVRYLRGQVNSGGCGAPRNDGLEAAPRAVRDVPRQRRRAAQARLQEHAAGDRADRRRLRHRADLPAVREERQDPALLPELFARRRTVGGIAEAPEMFLDSFSTNKLYRAEFLLRGGLRVPGGPALRGPRLHRRAVLRRAAVRRGARGWSTSGTARRGGATGFDLAQHQGDGQRPAPDRRRPG